MNLRVVQLNFEKDGIKETSKEVKSLTEAFFELGVVENEERRNAVLNGKKPYVISVNKNSYKFILTDESKYKPSVERARKKYESQKVA